MFATLFGFDLDRDMAATLITAALAVATWYARSKVTPVADPNLPTSPRGGNSSTGGSSVVWHEGPAT